MRRTLGRLAGVKPARYLEHGALTGLTGLHTDGSARSTLLYLYASTLDKIKAVPEHSLYRQSVEAVTRHRMALVEAVEPEGHRAWAEKAAAAAAEHPELFGTTTTGRTGGPKFVHVDRDGTPFLLSLRPAPVDIRTQEWDGEVDAGSDVEDIVAEEEDVDQSAEGLGRPGVQPFEMDPEPQLTVEQTEELEARIGAGLIEEVIQVAEGELQLVDTMLQAKPWEDLQEKPAKGQWEYFERKAS